MPDGDPIVIGQANTASNPGNETSLSRNEVTNRTVFVARNLNVGGGIRGQADGGGEGVRGISRDGYGVLGTSIGGHGVRGDSNSGFGVLGNALGTLPAILGTNNGVGGGVAGRGDTSVGVRGDSVSGVGVRGTSTSGIGVLGMGPIGGFFVGNLVVAGLKLFKIDHPLDPENRYLSHACVESSEMKNLYDGVASLDEDVHYLHRNGLLKPGHCFSLRWSRAGRETGSMRGVVDGDERPKRVILLYRCRSGPGDEWEDVKEAVELDWTPCNFGGERPWFVCLGVVNGVACGRRAAILYGPGRYFLCRHCYDLSYQSQRDNKMYRALYRAQTIRERLGGSANMTEPFPEKPKGMHWRTYRRLWWEHYEAEMEQMVGMRKWLDKLQQQLR